MLYNTNYGRICRDIIEWPVNVRLELFNACTFIMLNYSLVYKGNNKITKLRTILQRESQNS